MTYEEFLQLTEKNLKQYFPESFQERKVEIREVLKNNNIKLQGVYLSGSPSLHLRPAFISGILLSGA